MSCCWCRSGKPPENELYTIPFSHYCEIARWSLQLAGKDFTETSYLPAFHSGAPAWSYREQEGQGGTTSLPFYVEASGEWLDDSWQILAKHWGEVPEDVKVILNYKVGPQARTIFYSFFLLPEFRGHWRQVGLWAPVSCWQRFLWCFASGTIAEEMHTRLVKSDEFVQSSRKELDNALDQVEQMMLKPGNPFEPRPDGLPSPAGLALACLLDPVVGAEPCTGGFCDPVETIGGFEALPVEMQQLVEVYRARPAGKFVMEMYKQRMNFPAAACGK